MATEIIKADSFRIDNIFAQNVHGKFANRNPAQLYLPGMKPFGGFDLWVALGCFSMLDPENPGAEVETTLAGFMEVLDFARVVSSALRGRGETFESSDYAVVKASLHRLFTVEVVWSGFYNAYQTDKKGKRQRGRPKKILVEHHARVLQSYAYLWDADAIPPEQLPPSKRTNVNKARTLDNQEGPEVYTLEGRRPIGIRFRISTELLQGLTQEGANIGSTTIPTRIFKLRRKIGKNDHATVRFLIWAARQTKKHIKISMTKLYGPKNLDFDVKKRGPAYCEKKVLRSAKYLQDLGVLESFSYNEESGFFTATKAEEWHYPRSKDS